MSLGHGPRITTNGLIFAYDMGNTKKSWKGKPTVNLQDPDFNNWSKSATVNVLPITSPVNHTVYEIIDDNTGSYLSANRSLTVPDDSSIYTYSIYIKKTFGETSARLGFNYGLTGGSTIIQGNARFNSDTGAAVQGSAEDLGEWWRWQFSITNNSTGNTILYCNFYPATGFYNSGDNSQATGTAIVSGMQIEQNSFATPFVVGTRSNTQSILDLTGQKTATAQNLTYNSDNTFEFDGVDDYINLGTNLNIAVQTYTVMGWIYKTGSSTNNAAYIISGGFGGDRDGVMISTEVYATTNDIYISDLTDGAQVFHNGEPVATGTNFNLNEWLFFTVIYPVTSVDSGDHNIGRNNNNTNHFQGLISSLQIYDRELLQSEIKQCFNATRGRYGI